MVYYFIEQAGSLRLLETKLKNNRVGLGITPWETIRDCFSRFSKDTFRDLFINLVSNLSFIDIPELSVFGKLCLVDGSHFRINIKADWANFRSKMNGIKLHLIMNLNEMIIQDFKISKGKGSERDALKKLIDKGITYIMDRGYISFDLFNKISEIGSYFICRLKKNVYSEDIINTETYIDNFGKVSDRLIIFPNDPDKNIYRLVSFKYGGKYFNILTNRLDLLETEIIILYACRWQIELIFNYLKNSLKGKHILSFGENGVYIQFYFIAIVQLLLLNIKQYCLKLRNDISVPDFIIVDLLDNPVTNFGSKLKGYWKIGVHFLNYLKDVLEKSLSLTIVKELAAM